MEITDYIIDGLIEYLELERELGVRVVECDKTLLDAAANAPAPAVEDNKRTTTRSTTAVQPQTSNLQPVSTQRHRGTEVSKVSPCLCDSVLKNEKSPTLEQAPSSNLQPVPPRGNLVFLHDRPLSPKGVEMMAKIIVALGETSESAPIIIEKPVPKAKVYVVLGGRALAKFMPGRKAEPGDWIKSDGGKEVLVTYSPEYILRFEGISARVTEIKQSMWRSLKAAKQRLR